VWAPDVWGGFCRRHETTISCAAYRADNAQSRIAARPALSETARVFVRRGGLFASKSRIDPDQSSDGGAQTPIVGSRLGRRGGELARLKFWPATMPYPVGTGPVSGYDYDELVRRFDLPWKWLGGVDLVLFAERAALCTISRGSFLGVSSESGGGVKPASGPLLGRLSATAGKSALFALRWSYMRGDVGSPIGGVGARPTPSQRFSPGGVPMFDTPQAGAKALFYG